MTRRDWAAWALVLFVCVVIVPLVRWSDTAYAPQTDIAAAVLADGTDAAPAEATWTPWPCEDELALCRQQLYMADQSLRRWEELAESWGATGTAMADELARLRRTPYGPDPTATDRPGWRGWLPMAVRSW